MFFILLVILKSLICELEISIFASVSVIFKSDFGTVLKNCVLLFVFHFISYNLSMFMLSFIFMSVFVVILSYAFSLNT